LLNQGVDRFWETVLQFRKLQTDNDQLASRRKHQALAWMWERIEAGLRHDFRNHPAVRALLQEITTEVESGRLPASIAARKLLGAQVPRG
jgi:LAO/AO transport system kinase